MKECTRCSQRFNDTALICSRCGGSLELLPQAAPLNLGYASGTDAEPFLLSDPDIEPIPSGRPTGRENVVIRPQRQAPSHRQRRAAVRSAAPYNPDGQAADQNVYAAAEAPIYGTAAAQEYTAQRQTGDDSVGRRTIFGDEPAADAAGRRGGGLFGGREQGGTSARPGHGAGRIFQNIELALRYIIPGATIIAAIVMIIVNWQNIWGVIAHFMMFWIPSFFLCLWLFRKNFGMRAGTIVFITTLLAAVFTVLYYNIAGIGSGILSLLTPLMPLIIIAGALFFLLRIR